VRFKHAQFSIRKYKNCHKWAYEEKQAKAARKFVTLSLSVNPDAMENSMKFVTS